MKATYAIDSKRLKSQVAPRTAERLPIEKALERLTALRWPVPSIPHPDDAAAIAGFLAKPTDRPHFTERQLDGVFAMLVPAKRQGTEGQRTSPRSLRSSRASSCAT